MLDGQDDTDTPLKQKLNAVGKTLTVVGLIVCVLIFCHWRMVSATSDPSVPCCNLIGHLHYSRGIARNCYHRNGSGRTAYGKEKRTDP